jgi:hypothetical protein
VKQYSPLCPHGAHRDRFDVWPAGLFLPDFATEAPSYMLLVSDIHMTRPANSILSVITLNGVVRVSGLTLLSYYYYYYYYYC